jgi:hypothetical protein
MKQTDFIEDVKAAVKVINHTVEDGDLLNFVVAEVVDRVTLYLNVQPEDEIDARLVRVVARTASGVFNQTNATVESGEADTAITSVSDNGQSVHYSDKVRNYLASSDDGELFGGFAKLLARYRRVNVVS